MTTILRQWSYRYQWLYDAVTALSALTVGGVQRFRQLALQELQILPNTQVLDLCCGCGQVTQLLVQKSHHVVGLDASPLSLKRAEQAAPGAKFVQGWAEAIPFPDQQFDFVHTSIALHEMEPQQLQQILREVYRVLKPGGTFTCIDLHEPTNPLLIPAIAVFIWLFETETAWQLMQTDLVELLTDVGFQSSDRTLYAGGSLQVVRAYKTVEAKSVDQVVSDRQESLH